MPNFLTLKSLWGIEATGTLTLMGMQDGTAPLEDTLVVSYKTKQTYSHHVIQQLYALVYTQKSWNQDLEEISSIFTASLFTIFNL